MDSAGRAVPKLKVGVVSELLNFFGETFINKMCRDQDDDGATPLLLGMAL